MEAYCILGVYLSGVIIGVLKTLRDAIYWTGEITPNTIGKAMGIGLLSWLIVIPYWCIEISYSKWMRKPMYTKKYK